MTDRRPGSHWGDGSLSVGSITWLPYRLFLEYHRRTGRPARSKLDLTATGYAATTQTTGSAGFRDYNLRGRLTP